MSASKEKAKFAAIRLKRFLNIFLRNTKGIAGLAILIIFLVMAAGAPFLTPYDPILSEGLAGGTAAPTWLRYFPPALGGQPDLSENMWVVNDPGFKNPPAINSSMIGEWGYTKSPNITIQFDPNEGASTPGCLDIAFERNEVGKLYGDHSIYIYKDYDFPYSGMPKKFQGRIAFFVNGTGYLRTQRLWNETGSNWYYANITLFYVPVRINVIFEQVDTGQKLTIWPVPQIFYVPGFMDNPETVSIEVDGTVYRYIGYWWIVSSDLDSFNAPICQGLFRGVNPAQAMFTKKPGKYRYGVEITFQDEKDKNKPVYSTIYIDDIDFKILGTSWGLMGTDTYGRDLFTQLLYGTSISLYVGVLSAVLAIVIGLIVGLVAGYLGGIVDEVLMRFNDMLLVLPGLPLLIVLVAVLGAKIENLIILLGLLGWNGFARVVRSQVLSIKERPFIEAAKAVGAGKGYIIIRHIVPNVMSLTYVSLATTVPGNVMAEAALSFLGFYDPYRMSWGRMLYDVQFRAGAIQNWWWVVPPGLCIALLAISFVLLGYALDEVLNPKLRMRR